MFIKVNRITYDTDRKDKEPIILSGNNFYVTEANEKGFHDLWLGGNLEFYFKQGYHDGELNLGTLVLGTIFKLVNSCTDTKTDNKHLVSYNLEHEPEFLLRYCDIYFERVSLNDGKQSSLEKALFDSYKSSMSKLYKELETSEEKEQFKEKFELDAEGISKFFDARKEKVAKQNESLHKLFVLFDEAIKE